jgi:nitrite reductase/ring-hydroxylating ferredoxin subunit
MVQAPAACQFAAWPASWYTFAPVREIGKRPVSRYLWGRRWVGFHTRDGRPVILAADCSHQGADLARGVVEGACIRCPFHGWEYSADGVCSRIPASNEIPAWARQVSRPALDRHGTTFVFHGPRASFDLPFFEGRAPEDYLASRSVRWTVRCPWFMVGANGFDLQHLQPIHGRELISQPAVDSPSPHARRIRYRTRITGTTIADRLLKLAAGGEVGISITVWGGTLILVEARFRRATSLIQFSVLPRGPGRSLVDAVVFAPRRFPWTVPGVGRLALATRLQFTRAFVKEDLEEVGRIRYCPTTLIDADAVLSEYLQWLAALPSSSRADPLTGGRTRDVQVSS